MKQDKVRHHVGSSQFLGKHMMDIKVLSWAQSTVAYFTQKVGLLSDLFSFYTPNTRFGDSH
jgi:hypothetical protein